MGAKLRERWWGSGADSDPVRPCVHPNGERYMGGEWALAHEVSDGIDLELLITVEEGHRVTA
jgi:hypothetical protein